LIDRNDVLRGQHVVDSRTSRRLQSASGERLRQVSLDLFAALALRAELGHLQDAHEVRAGALRVHAAWLLARRQRMLDNDREAFLAFTDLDVAVLLEDINGGPTGS